MPNNGKYFFCQIMTVGDKWIVVRAIEIQQKIGGNQAFFRDNCTSILRKSADWAIFIKLISVKGFYETSRYNS